MGVREYLGPEGPEVELPRGDVTEGVVRIGETVRRPAAPHSQAVEHYLDHLAAVGFDASPRHLGRDRSGREVLTYLHGDVPADPPAAWAAQEMLLVSVAHLLGELHQASAGYAAERDFAAPAGSQWFQLPLPAGVDLTAVPAPPQPELVSHNDITPQNVVVRGGQAVGLVDFDMAGPTSKLLEVWTTAMYWVPLRDPGDLWPAWRGVDQAARLRAFVDAYGLSEADRDALVGVGLDHAERAWWRMKGAAEHLGGGWARMWAGGTGEAITRRRAWLAHHGDDLTRALLA